MMRAQNYFHGEAMPIPPRHMFMCVRPGAFAGGVCRQRVWCVRGTIRGGGRKQELGPGARSRIQGRPLRETVSLSNHATATATHPRLDPARVRPSANCTDSSPLSGCIFDASTRSRRAPARVIVCARCVLPAAHLESHPRSLSAQ